MEFKVGDRVKLNEYTRYSDYKEHKDQEATLIYRRGDEEDDIGDNYWYIQWDDGEHSGVFDEDAPDVQMIKVHAWDWPKLETQE